MIGGYVTTQTNGGPKLRPTIGGTPTKKGSTPNGEGEYIYSRPGVPPKAKGDTQIREAGTEHDLHKGGTK